MNVFHFSFFGNPPPIFSVIVKKQNYNKRDVLIFSLVFTPRVTHVAEIGLWTLRPRFLSGFNPPSAPDPIFILLSGFPFQNT